jgi:hypothetical protein
MEEAWGSSSSEFVREERVFVFLSLSLSLSVCVCACVHASIQAVAGSASDGGHNAVCSHCSRMHARRMYAATGVPLCGDGDFGSFGAQHIASPARVLFV